MHAFVKTGPADAIQLQEVAQPEIGEQELLVKVEAIGVGVHDEYFLPPEPAYPYVIGIEAAGTIEAVGSAVAGFESGQRIAFVSAMQPKGGTWAQYAAVSQDSLIMPVPEAVSFAEAATLPVPGNTILRAFHALPLQTGDTLFIAGGSGAIGSLAIQIAVARGFTVVASSSTKNHDYMRSLGASVVVDYHDADWTQQVRDKYPDGVDAAIAIQPNTSEATQAVVKDAGTIVTVSGDQFQPQRGIALQQIPHTVDVKAEMKQLMDQVASGDVQIHIEKTYPFKEGLAALEQVKTRHTRGKLVLTLGS